MINESEMAKISEKTKLIFDGGDDNRLFVDDEQRITVFAKTLGWNDYQRMEKMLRNFTIKRDKYQVYAWNDVSGYQYWRDGEETCQDSNYIQITASISDSNLNDIELEQLKNDIDDVYYEFEEFDNVDVWLYKRNA